MGRIYGAALAVAGHDVLGFDPFSTGPIDRISVTDDLERADRGAEMVFALTPASVGLSVAQEAAAALRPGIHDAEDGTITMIEKWTTAANFGTHAGGAAKNQPTG